MYTSCGWFFNDLAGLETVQILRYAARSMDLYRELGEEPPVEAFLAELSRARSNDPAEGDGRQIWKEQVDGSRPGCMLEGRGPTGRLPAVETPPQTCYRHPDRRGGVICQRCDRPICPDCMHQASVGFHCPECTKQGAQKVVRASQLGDRQPRHQGAHRHQRGRVRRRRRQRAEHQGPVHRGRRADRQRHRPERPPRRGGQRRSGTGSSRPGFLHENLIHIGLNMWVLYLLGQLMEPVLGRLRFALVYGVALIAGSLGVLILSTRTSSPSARPARCSASWARPWR